jgi:hypothetical protein
MNPVTALSTILASMPSASSIATQVAAGVAGTVILSGLQSQGGQNALDPLHLIFKPNLTTTTAASSSVPAVTTSAPVPTISAASYATLPFTIQNNLNALGVHII